jgi:predicted CXXCH cytochrome family protein
VRRLALLIAVGATWLFLAAIPALADGGPHVADNNSGKATLTTDGCAGCHRAHTAQGPLLLATTSAEVLCISCHGSAGTGATTNVADGLQYAVRGGTGTDAGLRGTGVAGALRAGGFVNARISASGPLTRVPYPRDTDTATAGTQGPDVSFSEYVPAIAPGTAGQPVTSAHMHVGTGPDVTGPGIAWGNGTAAGAGPTVVIDCASCHNVHGNNQYRILNPVPDPESVAAGSTFSETTVVPIAVTTGPPGGAPGGKPGAFVQEVRANPTGGLDAGVRNYTVKWGATLADVINGTYPNAASPNGDYWRRLQPYDAVPQWTGVTADAVTNPATYYRGDMPEYIPAGNTGASGSSTAWRTNISNWCSTCHTKYHTANPGTGTSAGVDYGFGNGRPYASGTGSYDTSSGDATFNYRHGTSNSECTQCHVSHGSNAAMTGKYSANYPYPNTDLSASSRLLKVSNRGTCQACHDPTETTEWDDPAITQP